MLTLPTFCIYWARDFGRIEVEAMVNLTGEPRFLDTTIDTHIINQLQQEVSRLEAERNREKSADPLQIRGTSDAIKVVPLVVIAGGEAARQGFGGFLSSAVVGEWTAFETFAGDLWEAALNVHPFELAELKGAPWTAAKGNDESEGSARDLRETKLVRLDWIQRVRYDSRNSMGTLLKDRFEFSSFADIKNAYVIAWSNIEDQKNIKAILGNSELDLLQSARNLLVHKGGIVDQRFLRRITDKSTRQINPIFAGAAIDQLLPVNGVVVAHFMTVMIGSATKLLAFVDNWLSDHNDEGNAA